MQFLETPQTAYIVNLSDNVATALGAITSGAVCLHGNFADGTVLTAVGSVKRGYKLALRPLAVGEPVIKYGVPVAIVTEPVKAGECVHLHNVKSYNDERAKEYDVVSAEPKDRRYNLDR